MEKGPPCKSLAARVGNPPRDASTRVNYRVRATDSRTSVTRPRDDDDGNISPPSSLKTNSRANSVGSHRSNRRSAPICLEKFPDEILQPLPFLNRESSSLKIFLAFGFCSSLRCLHMLFLIQLSTKISFPTRKKGASSNIKVHTYMNIYSS